VGDHQARLGFFRQGRLHQKAYALRRRSSRLATVPHDGWFSAHSGQLTVREIAATRRRDRLAV
jgi:hypothetical protein